MRITILQESLALLENQKLGHLAWKILDTAVDTPNPEVHVAIIGSTGLAGDMKSLLQHKRLQSSLDRLRRVEIPLEHRERFVHKVLYKLATTSKEEDIKVCPAALVTDL